uniref:Secreted protein n=1 Tax=Heterorhabditis bacteriophora TaxID=37862 RepID=A0A1I7WFD2_HETBA
MGFPSIVAFSWLWSIARRRRRPHLFKALVSVTKSSKSIPSCTFVDGSLTKCLVNIWTSFRYFTSILKSSKIHKPVKLLLRFKIVYYINKPNFLNNQIPHYFCTNLI